MRRSEDSGATPSEETGADIIMGAPEQPEHDIRERINAEHRACELAARSAVEHAVRCGELLLEAREELVPTGEWEAWLRENFDGSLVQAWRYQRLAREYSDDLSRVKGESLRSALREIGSPVEGETPAQGNSAEPAQGSPLRKKILADVERAIEEHGEEEVASQSITSQIGGRKRRKEADARSREKLLRRAEEAREAARHYPRFECCDFDELGVKDGEVNLVLTDPMYGEAHLKDWERLGSFGARVLKDDGFLVAYAGSYHLPQEMAGLGEKLYWRWLLAAGHREGANTVFRRGMNSFFKPVLVYSKGAQKPKHGPVNDLLWMGGDDGKGRHPYGQPYDEAEKLLLHYTDPGDLVCDPFAGGGTNLLAAMLTGRRSVGAEEHPEEYGSAKRDIDAAWARAHEEPEEDPTVRYRRAYEEPVEPPRRTPTLRDARDSGGGFLRATRLALRDARLSRLALEESPELRSVAAAIARGFGSP